MSLKKILFRSVVLSLVGLSVAQADTLQWLNHFGLVSGNPQELSVSTNSTSSGIGGGLTGVVVKSSTVGSTFSSGGNKVVHMGLQMPLMPPGINIRGVRVCYELSNAATYISQIRIAEVQQNPPSSAIVRMDDATPLNAVGPICVNSLPTNIATNAGPLLFSLRFNFANVADSVVIRGLGVYLG